MTYFVINRYPLNKIDPLIYEVKMLNDTYLLYWRIGNEPLKSVVLESFLLHSRILIDFLENNRSEKNGDDLTCVNFIDIDGNPIEGAKVKLKRGTKNAINKHLAHLTLKRADSKAQWNITEIRDCINNDMRSFLDKCADSNFPDSAEHWKRAFFEQFERSAKDDELTQYRQSA